MELNTEKYMVIMFVNLGLSEFMADGKENSFMKFRT